MATDVMAIAQQQLDSHKTPVVIVTAGDVTKCACSYCAMARHLLAMQAVADVAGEAVEYGYDRGKMVAALDKLKEGR